MGPSYDEYREEMARRRESKWTMRQKIMTTIAAAIAATAAIIGLWVGYGPKFVLASDLEAAFTAKLTPVSGDVRTLKDIQGQQAQIIQHQQQQIQQQQIQIDTRASELQEFQAWGFDQQRKRELDDKIFNLQSIPLDKLNAQDRANLGRFQRELDEINRHWRDYKPPTRK